MTRTRTLGSARRSRATIGRLASCVLVTALASVVVVPEGRPAAAAGSRNLFPAAATGSRANLEWRTSTYGGGLLKRRTLIHVFANAGEQILMGSTGVGVGEADILVFNPGAVTGPIGQEVIPAVANFSCEAQRPDTTTTNIGRIRSRAEELAGPLPSAGGYEPCRFSAPTTGIYSVIMIGPNGRAEDANADENADRRGRCRADPVGQLRHQPEDERGRMGCDRTSQCHCDGGHPWSRLQLLPRHLHRGQRPAGQQHVLHHEHGRPPLLGVARHRRQRLRRVRQLDRLPRRRFHAGTAEAAVSRCARREQGNPCPADALGRRCEPVSTGVPDLLRAARRRDPAGARDSADTDAADAVDRRRSREQPAAARATSARVGRSTSPSTRPASTRW